MVDTTRTAASASDAPVTNQEATPSLLNFDAYISERTRDFSGRDWVFRRIDTWLSDTDGKRYFLLTGEQGSGKTAIAARLVQMSRGATPPPADTAHTGPGLLSAIHFCSARDASWIDPTTFARSIALQLTTIPGFGNALLSHAGSGQTTVQGQAQAGTATSGAVVAGVYIGSLTLSAVDPVETFNRLVLLPLRTVYANGFDQPVTILVDGLDESLSRQGAVNIVELLAAVDSLPRGVRFILTSRRDEAVESGFLNTEGLFLSAPQFEGDTSKDIGGFVSTRLTTIPDTAGMDDVERTSAVSTVLSKADGNFRYAQFLLDSLEKGQHSLTDLEHLPPGLDALYHLSLSRLVAYANVDWSDVFAPLMGPLAVAREPLTALQLRRFSGKPSGSVLDNLRRLQQFVEELPPPTPPGADANDPEAEDEYRYRLYHDSVATFLDQPVLDPVTRVPNRFHLVFAEWHQRVANYYLGGVSTTPWDTWDDYGLRYVPGHLGAAIDRQPADERHPDVERLVKLVLNPVYQQTHLDNLDDPVALERSLEDACFSAALDDDPTALKLVVGSALERVVFRREKLRPDSLFKLASGGQLQAAERRLTLFPIEPDWRRAVLLILAWLAAPLNPADAQLVCDQVDAELGGLMPDGPLQDLREYARAALVGQSVPPLRGPIVLTAQAQPEVVRETLARIGGYGRNTEMLQAYANSLLNPNVLGGSAAPAYLAQQDAPLLVGYAAQDLVEGTRTLLEYIGVHAGYAYVEYRNQSLWHVLDAVVRHPQPDWVRGMAPIVAGTALAVTGMQFQEGLPLTIKAVRAAAAVPAAAEQFKTEIKNAIDQAPPPDVPYERGEGDAWGSHRRRLASLAEAQVLVLGGGETVDRLLGLAEKLWEGFAGFQAPASLRVAEAIRICRTPDEPAVQAALQRAHSAAHNIQDGLFCARTTSRVNAMRQRWWGLASLASDNLPALAKRLMRSPVSPEFSALHIIGEKYAERTNEPGKMPLQEWLREAATLDELAAVYSRPVLEFRRQNPAYAQGLRVADGEIINVPDPGFVPLLAARLAAEALVDASLAGTQRVRQRTAVIRALVPVAAANPTALDTVLSRLLLVARPSDPAVLDELERMALRATAEGPAGGQLQAVLTPFTP